MTTSVRSTSAHTADVLVAMLRYLELWAPRHPELIPAVTTLQGAARRYRDGDVNGAYGAAVAAYQLAQKARTLSPALPEP